MSANEAQSDPDSADRYLDERGVHACALWFRMTGMVNTIHALPAMGMTEEECVQVRAAIEAFIEQDRLEIEAIKAAIASERLDA